MCNFANSSLAALISHRASASKQELQSTEELQSIDELQTANIHRDWTEAQPLIIEKSTVELSS